MSKKIIINNIESCDQCPYRDWDEIGSQSLYCSLTDTDKDIADSSIIPDWCPLEDDETNDEGGNAPCKVCGELGVCDC